MCHTRGIYSDSFLSRTDRSEGTLVCEPVADVVDVAKGAYYAVRLLDVLLGL